VRRRHILHLSVCPFCDEHDPKKQVGVALVDTGTAIASMCCRLDCLDCGTGYTTCDCTEYPRDSRRHPFPDIDENEQQPRPLFIRRFGHQPSNRCPVCYRKHGFRCPRCNSGKAKPSVSPSVDIDLTRYPSPNESGSFVDALYAARKFRLATFHDQSYFHS